MSAMSTKVERLAAMVDDKTLISNLIRENSNRINLIEFKDARADIWQHFRLVQLDGTTLAYAVCVRCLKPVSYKAREGTGGLHRHPCSKQAAAAAVALPTFSNPGSQDGSLMAPLDGKNQWSPTSISPKLIKREPGADEDEDMMSNQREDEDEEEEDGDRDQDGDDSNDEASMVPPLDFSSLNMRQSMLPLMMNPLFTSDLLYPLIMSHMRSQQQQQQQQQPSASTNGQTPCSSSSSPSIHSSTMNAKGSSSSNAITTGNSSNNNQSNGSSSYSNNNPTSSSSPAQMASSSSSTGSLGSFPMPLQFLYSNGSLRSDCLAMVILNDNKKPERRELMDGLADLLERKILLDASLSCKGGADVLVHKVVLSACSPVFEDMFLDSMSHPPARTSSKSSSSSSASNRNLHITELDLSAFEHSTVRSLVEYIYYGELNDAHSNILEMMKIADMFDFKSLKFMCAQRMYRNLSAENAIQYLATAEGCNCEELKQLIPLFVAENAPKVTSSNSWKETFKDRSDLVANLLNVHSMSMASEVGGSKKRRLI